MNTSYKTSQALKRIGFDGKTQLFFPTATTPMGTYAEGQCMYSSKSENHNTNKVLCSAPNIIQAQLWLWEKHKLWVKVTVYRDRFLWDVDISGELNSSLVMSSKSAGLAYFNQPIEALDLGIRAACEWIEKQEKNEDKGITS